MKRRLDRDAACRAGISSQSACRPIPHRSLTCWSIGPLAGLVLATASVAADIRHADLPRDLAAAAANYDQAQIHGDRKRLEIYLADDYVLVNSRGEVENKAGLIADYTAKGFSLKPYVVVDEVIRVWPNSAVLGGIVTLEGTNDGVPFSGRLNFADVWRKRNGRWQVVFTEVTRHASK